MVSLSRTILNASGQKAETDAYFNLSGISYSSSSVYLGTEGTNFYATYYAYDVNGNLDRTEDPSGTIYRTVFDGQGRVVSKWVGTNDTPTSGAWSPSNPAGMVEVESDVYDGGGVGDGDLTQKTLYTGEGGSDPNEVTDYFYDWRDRLVAEKDGVQSSESTSVNRPITFNTYDNLNEIDRDAGLRRRRRDDHFVGGVPNAPSSEPVAAQTATDLRRPGPGLPDLQYSVDPSILARSAAIRSTPNTITIRAAT